MNRDGYDVKWHDHSAEMFSIFRGLRSREVLSDLVLYCGDKQFRAHKVILAACCTFFEKVVNDLDPRASAALIVTDAAPDLLELVLDFVYNGEVFLDATQLDPFMALAAKLEVRGLKMMEKVGDLFVKQDATPGATSATTTTTSTATATAAATPGGNNRKRVVAVDSNANERNNKKPKADCNGKTAGFDASNGRLVSSSASVKDGANVNAKAIFKRFLPGVTIEPSATSLRSDLIVAKRVPGHKMIPAMEDTRTSSVGSDDIEGDIVELDQELPLVKAEYAEEEDEEDYVEDEDFLPGDMMKDETLSDFHDGGEDQEQPSNIPPEICIAYKIEKVSQYVWRGWTKQKTRMYFCGVCQYTCTEGSRLKRHIVVHTGEKPYKCTFCDATYTQRSSVLRHMKSHSKVEGQ